MLLGKLLDEAHDLPAGRGVETAGRFIQEEYPWACHELGSNADSSLLAPRDTFADRCADDGV